MNNVVLSLKNIVRVYEQGGNALRILDGLNMEVKQGEVVALVGPSGSGKTTLLQIAGLLDTPTSGEVMIAGIQYFPPPFRGRIKVGVTDTETNPHPNLPPKRGKGSDFERTLARRQHIGFVYQFHQLLPEFSALENVMIPQMIANISLDQAKTKAASLLNSLGLRDRTTHRPAKLSGGEQQRVAIARALANDPELLLADEPTGNLDPHTAADVFALFMRMAKEKNLAALVATHNLELAKRMDRIVQLENGTIK